MQTKYCLPIIKNRKDDVLKTIRINMNDYSYFEVWLDYIDNVDGAFIEELRKLLKERLILLFRRKNLEKIEMDLEKRVNIICLLKNSRSLLDLDVFDQKDELDYIRNNKLKVSTIVSYHNYKETPSGKTLKEIIDIMNKHQPTIFKTATMCNSQKDALRLLELLLDLKKINLKYIILGMGEHGIVTRIFGTLWGNEMIFAPKLITDQSASGQLTKGQLEAIFTILGQ